MLGKNLVILATIMQHNLENGIKNKEVAYFVRHHHIFTVLESVIPTNIHSLTPDYLPARKATHNLVYHEMFLAFAPSSQQIKHRFLCTPTNESVLTI
jgi:hypothetical protein